MHFTARAFRIVQQRRFHRSWSARWERGGRLASGMNSAWGEPSMKRRDMLAGTGAMALGLGLGGFPIGWAADKSGTTRRGLFFSKSSGVEHPVIKRKGDQLGHAERVLAELGAKHGFDVTATKDGRVFTPENLAKYDAILF